MLVLLVLLQLILMELKFPIFSIIDEVVFVLIQYQINLLHLLDYQFEHLINLMSLKMLQVVMNLIRDLKFKFKKILSSTDLFVILVCSDIFLTMETT